MLPARASKEPCQRQHTLDGAGAGLDQHGLSKAPVGSPRLIKRPQGQCIVVQLNGGRVFARQRGQMHLIEMAKQDDRWLPFLCSGNQLRGGQRRPRRYTEALGALLLLNPGRFRRRSGSE